MFLKSRTEFWDNPVNFTLRFSCKGFRTKLLDTGFSMSRHVVDRIEQNKIGSIQENPYLRLKAVAFIGGVPHRPMALELLTKTQKHENTL